MKRSGKILGTLFALLLVMIVLPGVNAQAASSTDYAMGDTTRSVTKYGYSVKISNNKLYARKGNGAWKCIVSNSNVSCFTTNGSVVCYATISGSSSNSKSTIYSISVNGKNKIIIKQVSVAIEKIFRYKNQLVYGGWIGTVGFGDPNI